MTNTQINDKILELANYLKIDNKCVAHNARLQSIQINGAVIKNFSFKLFNEYKLSFFNCKFLCEINEAPGFFEIENPVYIYGCTFEENVISYNIKFKSNVVIAYCRFNKNFYFEANTFCNSSNFERNFYNYASFKKSHFEKNVTFYNSTFKGLDFSQAIFNENLNIVNTKLNFTFSNLEEKIEQEYEEFNKNKKEEDQKSLDKFANDFRDSFRTFKSALIKDNNALDASNFHKYELYCKEIELKNKKYKTLKDKMDKWQLIFYRKLCDHHTDILQSLNSLILVIGIFVISSVAMVFGFNYSLGYKPILEHWYFSLDFYNHHINSIIQDNYLFMMAINIMILFIYLGLIGFALCLKYMRKFFIIISYAITLSVLVVSPKILIPAMGFFTDKRAILDPLSAIGGIYTIVFGFVVFSFIKTIRKNSIVPS
ncbi:pentapeptide repeat-containing protein [Campylobacter coli]|uniref:pentapeptide repeat-containing protein n=1 Tax=Campylobacter coli TaxID=195 RepID=UPI001F08BA03|nr:pentapeptide repeat-containing protein [Campylobacter coli]MCH3779483.1 pentapeptide repeat-containing protein [Campylobacter coli]